MKRRVSPFKLGVFVLLGLGFGLGGLLWVGASGFLQPTRTYASFFDFSVAGLAIGAPVSYRGVNVGQVDEIGVAPDDRLIRVLVKIRKDFEPDANMYLQPARAGLAGQSFLSLERAQAGAVPALPRLTFDVDYPLLPNAPGDFDQFLERAEAVVNDLAALELQTLVAEWRAAGAELNALVGDAGLRRSVAQIDAAAADLRRMIGALAGAEPGQWQEMRRDLVAATEALRAGSRQMAAQLTALERGQLAETVERMEAMASAGEATVRSIDRQADASFDQLQRNMSEVSRLLTDLDRLIRSLRREPGQILERREGRDPFDR